MTLIVVSDNSKIGTGIQIGLSVDNQGDPDSLLVTAGSTVASTTAAAVVGLADGHSIDVEGTVVGEDIAISLGFGGHSSGHHLVIGKTGYVSNSLAPSAAVVINAHDSTVDNAGTIRGQTRGLEFQGGSNSDSSNINNSGLIEAADFAIVHAASSDQRVGLNNTGEIRATNIWAAQTYSYYSSGSAQDSVYNSGLMVGEVFLGGGNDVYDGRGGRVLFGVSGLTGSVDGGASADTLIGGEFSDILAGGDDNDEINGGAGGDQLAGDEGDDTLFGEDGNDAIGGGIGNDTMSGGLGDDQLGGVAGDDTLNGDAGNDTLNGGAGKDTISGGDGDDQLNGGADDDTLSGSAGNDTLNGDAGKDTMSGGLGNDQLNGGADSDTMAGDAGNDALNGGGGADTMDGAAGNDSFLVDNAADVVIDFGGGIDLVQSSVTFNLGIAADAKGTVENLTLIGTGNIAGVGNALANKIIGNAGNNVISGVAGSDSLFGSGGNDVVKGDAGNDVLNGGNGIDRLYGGLGNDTMTGGALADRFVFDTAPNAATNRDTIADFQHNLDDMWLDNAMFTALGGNGGLKVAFFHAGKAAHDADDHVIYDKATGALFYDADGTGAQAQVQFATLSNKALLTAADFVVI